MARIPVVAIAVPRAGLTQQTSADHAIGATSKAERILQGLDFRTLAVGRRACRCDRLPHGRRAAVMATVREVKSALSEQPNVYRSRSLWGLTVGRFRRPSTRPRRLMLRPHDCGLPAPWFGLPQTSGMGRSGDSPGLICGLFRMFDALPSGSYAQRYYGLARMRCRWRRWTLCAWERAPSYVDVRGGWWNSLRLII